jgi:DnaK suppressor protein
MTKPDHLTNEQLGGFQTEIVREIALLTSRMKASADTVRPVELDPGAVGRLSRMDELQNQAMAKSLREREQQRLGDLQRALERIETATFGLCASCGGEIPYARLEAFPEAPTCMPCSR